MWKIVVFLSFFAHVVYCQQQQVVAVSSAQRANLTVSVIWDDCTQSVYYTDLYTTPGQACLFRYDYQQDQTYAASITGFGAAAFIVPKGDCGSRDNKFAVGLGRYTYTVVWDGVSSVATVSGQDFQIPDTDQTKHNAVARQSLQGHYYGGSYDPSLICSGQPNAMLYRYTTAGGVQPFASGQVDTSGWAFIDDIIYQIDTCKNVSAFDASCTSNCQATTVFDFRSVLNEYLVGLESTTSKKLLSGSYTSGAIYLIDPSTQSGQVLAKLPYAGCGGVALGGPNHDILFAIVGSTVIDPANPAVVVTNNNGPSLYKILNTGYQGPVYSSLTYN